MKGIRQLIDALAGPRENPDISPSTHPEGWQVTRIEVLAVFREADYLGVPLGAMQAAYAFTEEARRKERESHAD